MTAAEGLAVERVRAGYGQADVLEDESLTTRSGRITCLLGANGSDKTTLIRAILGLTPPRAGRISFAGRDLTGLPTHRVIAAGIACIPEGRKVFSKLTVEENLRVGGYQESSEPVVRRRIDEVFELFPQLRERRRQLAGTMSGGEQAMVSFGRGLMRAPKVLLIDEPSLGLAPIYVKQNFAIIKRIRAQGVTVFLVEQNVHQTLAIADYGYVLAKGRLVAEGPPDRLAANPEVHQAYFG
jgi:branched-chain amino acid transport system ATP-binding protein